MSQAIRKPLEPPAAVLQPVVAAGQALARERERRRRDGAPDEVLLGVERDLAELLADYMHFELQSGHSEQAIACLQALVEFNCFAPAFPGPCCPLTSRFISDTEPVQP